MENSKKNVSKTSIIRILQILEKHSDPNHPMQHQEIADYLDKEFGIVMERKAIGYNVKLLAEMFADDNATIKVVTKRKLGTYITRRYMADDDVAFLVDLVLSNYSINDEHRQRLCEQLRAMTTISYRLQQPMPEDFCLIDSNDSEDYIETKQLQGFDDIEDGIVDVVRMAIAEKKTIAFDYSVQGEGTFHYLCLPVYIGIYNNRYYAFCFTLERKFIWIRMDYMYAVEIKEKAVDAPRISEFIAKYVPKPEREDFSYDSSNESFVLVVDNVVKPECLVAHFGTAIEFTFDKKAHLYLAKFVSNEDKVRKFADCYYESVVVVEPEWCETKDNRHRLLSYYRRKKNSTGNN